MKYKQEYLEEGAVCPYCKGTDIVAIGKNYYGEGDFVSKPPKISTAMNCENCGKEWFDVYRLVDVEPVDEIVFEGDS